MGLDIRIDNARISFAHGLWTASAAVVGAEKKFNADFIVSDGAKVFVQDANGKFTAPITLDEAALRVATEEFKGDKKKAAAWIADLDARQQAIRDGSKKKDKAGDVVDGYDGYQYISAKNKKRPPVYDGQRNVIQTAEESPIFSGCRVIVRLELYCNMKAGQKGLFASLKGTQFFAKDDAFGGGAPAGADDFEELSAGADAADFG